MPPLDSRYLRIGHPFDHLCVGDIAFLNHTCVLRGLGFIVGEYLLTEIEDRQWAWNTGGGACRDDGKIPVQCLVSTVSHEKACEQKFLW